MQKLKAEIENWLKENEAKRSKSGGQYLLGVSEGYASVLSLIETMMPEHPCLEACATWRETEGEESCPNGFCARR